MPATREPAPTGSRVVLAIDFGLRRIGIATGNLLTRTATPLATLHAARGIPWAELDALVRDWQPGAILIGIPGTGAGGAIESRIRELIDELEARYTLPVESVDEALSSRAAQSELRERRRSGHLRRRVGKDRVDSHAACLIAEQWMSRY